MSPADATKSSHYSYAVYADPAMAERFDAMRFSGPIGRLIADTQEIGRMLKGLVSSLERSVAGA